MAEMWICGDCRSANTAKSKRCYRCSVPRATAELSAATEAGAAATVERVTTVLAAATRLGVRYRTTWPLAILSSALILASTAIDVVRTQATLTFLRPDGSMTLPPPADAQRLNALAVAYFVCFLLAGLGWSLWIAIVVANLPALTARWPRRSPIGAFLASWIPIVNLKRPYSVVREVTTILSEATLWPALVVIAWWVAWLTWRYGLFFIVLAQTLGARDRRPGVLMASGTTSGLVLEAIAALLAVWVIVVVEYQQRLALDRRAETVLGSMVSGSPAEGAG